MGRRLTRLTLAISLGMGFALILALSVMQYDPPRLALADDGENLKTDLVAWYDLEEASGVRYDEHTNDYDLTDVNTVGRGSGIVNYGSDHEADDFERFSHGDNADFSCAGHQDFTIAAWFKPETSTTDQAHVSHYTWVGDQWGWLLYTQSDDDFAFLVSDDGSSGTIALDNVTGISDTSWYYMIGWHDAAEDTVNIQVNNGAIYSASHSGGVYDASVGFYVGYLAEANAWPTDGVIDSVALWHRVLSSTERTWLYNSGNGRAYSDLGVGLTPTPTPTATYTPTATTTPTVMVGSVYTMSLPSGGTGTVTASADFGSLLTTGAVVGVGIVVLAWVSYQKARLMSKKL